MPNPPPPNLDIRPARLDDAEACIAHVHHIVAEFPDLTSHAPGEFDATPEQECQLITAAAASDNTLYLLALVDDQLVGLLHYAPASPRRAHRHAVTLGVSVRHAWCDRGIGTALMHAAIAHARDSRVVRRIELFVYTHNPRAAHLYRKLGFTTEGLRRRTAHKDGQDRDDLIMALLLD
jgi:RimJ/RimL family protein N-acetyltransferase